MPSPRSWRDAEKLPLDKAWRTGQEAATRCLKLRQPAQTQRRFEWVTRTPPRGMTNAQWCRAKVPNMTEYRKQSAFLKELMGYDESAENRLLRDRLRIAERNERCVLSACGLVAIIALFGVAGLGYSAVLLRQFFDGHTHVLIRIFGALGLGAGLCLVFWIGLWFYYRSAVNRVHEECRRRIAAMLEARLHSGAARHYPLELDVVDIQLFASDATAAALHSARKAA